MAGEAGGVLFLPLLLEVAIILVSPILSVEDVEDSVGGICLFLSPVTTLLSLVLSVGEGTNTAGSAIPILFSAAGAFALESPLLTVWDIGGTTASVPFLSS